MEIGFWQIFLPTLLASMAGVALVVIFFLGANMWRDKVEGDEIDRGMR